MSWRPAAALGLLAVSMCLSASLAAQSTRGLRVRGMLIDSDQMQDTLSAPFWKAVAATPCAKPVWTPNYSSLGAFGVSREPALTRLRRETGPLFQPAGNVLDRQLVLATPRYRIERLVLGDRIPNATSFGWLATPIGKRGLSAPVILVQGSGMAPQEAFDWQFQDQYPLGTRYDSTAFTRSALELVEAGYTVFVPWIADNNTDDAWPLAQWQALNRTGASLSAKLHGRGAFALIVNQIVTVGDFLLSLETVDKSKLSVIGWADGAQVASAAAALDVRVQAVVRLAAPLDRAALRRTPEGARSGVPFMHFDCSLDDFQMAALVAPRPLLFAYSLHDESVARPAKFISQGVANQVSAMYAALGRSSAFGIQADTTWRAVNMRRVRMWLDTAVTFTPRDVAAVPARPRPPSRERYYSANIDSTRIQRRAFVASFGSCIAPVAAPDYSSAQSYLASVAPLRRSVANILGVPQLATGFTMRIVRRDTLLRRAKYVLEYVEAVSSHSAIPLVGLLATPATSGLFTSPAVISANGIDGFANLFGLNGREKSPYMNAYGDELASDGYVVFAPFLPRALVEIAPEELRSRNPDGVTTWSLIVPYFVGAVDLVRSLPNVDTSRVAMSGISFGGFPALFTAALDTRVNGLVFSNPVNTASVLFKSPDSAGLAPWYGEICSVIDPALTYLIAPRRLVRENGARDTNGYETTPLETIDAIRAVYDRLGLSNLFEFVRHPGGHEIVPRGIF